MKNNILLLVLIIITFTIKAQNLEEVLPTEENLCGLSAFGSPMTFNPNELLSARFTLTATQYVFNVKVHFISNNVPVSQQELKTKDEKTIFKN